MVQYRQGASYFMVQYHQDASYLTVLYLQGSFNLMVLYHQLITNAFSSNILELSGHKEKSKYLIPPLKISVNKKTKTKKMVSKNILSKKNLVEKNFGQKILTHKKNIIKILKLDYWDVWQRG